MSWLLLILTLPTENATARMRAWRLLKTSGAVVLRDGVYLLPAQDGGQLTLTGIADDIKQNGGTAYLLNASSSNDDFSILFDRTSEFAQLLAEINKNHNSISDETLSVTLKQIRKLRKTFEQLVTIDFFPGEAQKQTAAALQELERSINRKLSPDEPHAATGTIPRFAIADYQGCIWATRARPWADRLASAWLIRRFIDPNAQLLWLDSPADCPAEAVGFDFDGAIFSHVEAKVTFETLLASFNLDFPALLKIAGIIHFLDVGGIQPPEAAGIERVLAGLYEAITDDNQLFATASTLFDGLFAAFEKESLS